MTEFGTATPVVLSLSSHDPSGASGIQADIECAASLGCHATSVITALCSKNSRHTHNISPLPAALLIEQTRSLLEDMPVQAIRIGFVGSVENAEAIHSILRDYPQLPVVLDPATSICNGELADADAIVNATENLLMPLATVVTPDMGEAQEISPQSDTPEACAHQILESGCHYLLISGARRTQDTVENHLYNGRGLLRKYQWQRLPMQSHGNGATLAASIACYLAHGLLPEEAISQGQNFTWQALAHSRRLGMGHHLPNRFFWANGHLSQSGSGHA
ncbi:hydroxymethylpyrimidine/phosphomethylpyrimidine kinase [Pseudomaricurvus sp. HS19]|uniref:bifunctional hydroxymethylpyrimidine kinase/phosphomethylpyrimidine kinase n=1 Tax=Pseudomaricurvus sp. HS19 TaxID=2692626 RepID=UPI00136BA192|nr:hydroxymethylpyrimidine/phosphomethylpyrimidine kinase [Pseudomaricurvus sp. HS19]MYM63269.1 hydroxymethylpyrimidine/phosphomethylpyrimidine kinase [Pseudomaricurvus sp. HS19]